MVFQDKDYVKSLCIVFGTALALSIGFMGPLALISSTEKSKYTDLLSKLDSNPSFAAASVEACVAKGYPKTGCQASLHAAEHWQEQGYGTTLHYNRMATCRQHHAGKCLEDSWSDGINVGVNYVPQVVGWQALSSDLKSAAPLFATSQKDMGVRYDGKLIKLQM